LDFAEECFVLLAAAAPSGITQDAGSTTFWLDCWLDWGESEKHRAVRGLSRDFLLLVLGERGAAAMTADGEHGNAAAAAVDG